MPYHNLPPTQTDPSRQMFPHALGLAPGLGRMTGRRILVVGGGQRKITDAEPPIGNGRGICRVLGREGAKVAVLDHSFEAAQFVCDEIKGDNGFAVPIVADATDVARIKPSIEEAAKALGGLDGLVLNVGITSVGLDKLTVEHWDDLFAINVRSHMWYAKAGLECLEPGSSILVISSLAGMRPGGHQPAYEISKAAQYQLARTVAFEGEPKGIRCNCLALGLIDSAMGRDEGKKRPDRARLVPFARQGTGWEVGYAALFFLSHESSYVNAQTLCVDGGQVFGVVRK